jgi:hypothetical protein
VPSYCPRSSLPAKVLGWLAAHLAHLTPPRRPGQGGARPLSLQVRLDAVAAVLLDGLSYRRAGRMVGMSKTEVGDSLDLLLGPLAALGFCQPDGTFITSLDELSERLGEMAEVGEAVCVDGLATRVQRPSGWANQEVLYDAKRHAHTAQGLSLSTIWATCCGWTAAGRAAATSMSCWDWRGWRGRWTTSRSSACWTGGFGAWPRRASTGMPRSGTGAPSTGSATPSGPTTACRRAARAGGAVDRAPGQRLVVAPLAWAAVPGPGRFRAAGALVCLGRWLHRVPT